MRSGSLPGWRGRRHRISDSRYRFTVSEDDTPSFPPPRGPPFLPPSEPPDPPGASGRRGWLIAGVVVVLALGGGVLALLLTRGDGDGTTSPPESSVPEITFPTPTTAAPTVPELPLPTLPTLPELSLPSLPDISIPDLPDLSLPDLPDLSFPEFTIPGTTVADLIPPPTEEPGGLGTDGALDELAEECYDADMQACDDLYEQAPADSEYEAYGDTCAGRQPEQTRRYCSDVFG